MIISKAGTYYIPHEDHLQSCNTRFVQVFTFKVSILFCVFVCRSVQYHIPMIADLEQQCPAGPVHGQACVHVHRRLPQQCPGGQPLWTQERELHAEAGQTAGADHPDTPTHVHLSGSPPAAAFWRPSRHPAQ